MTAQIYGRLSITVVKGTNLFPKAAGGTSHPYCVVTLPPDSSEKTSVIESSLNPEWNEFFTFNIYSPFETLEFTLYDQETGQFIGKAAITLESISDQQSHHKTLELVAREMQDEVSGSIDVTLQYKFTDSWVSLYAGIQAVESADYEKGIELLSNALEQFPNEIRLFESRSKAYIHSGELKLALSDAVRVRDINPNVSNGHYRIGQVYQAAGKLDEAKKAYTAGLIYSNKDPQILAAIEQLVNPNAVKKNPLLAINDDQEPLVQTLYNTGKYKEALDEINFMIKRSPRTGMLYLGRIVILIALGKKQSKGTNLNRAELVKMINSDSILLGQLTPSWAKQNALKMGYMKKGGEFNRLKKRRWFILTNPLLFYYSNKGDSEPKGAIPVPLGVIRKTGKDKFAIKVPGREYELTLKSNIDSWIAEIKKTNELSLSFPTVPNTLQSRNEKRVTSSHKSLRLVQMLAESTKKVQLLNRKNVIREGILYKTGKLSKAWKKRFFILKPMEMYYFEDEPTGPSPTALGVIELQNCIWKKGEGDSFAQHMFELETPLRTFHFYAITRDDMYEWKAAIELCSQEDFRPSSLSLREDSFISHAAPKELSSPPHDSSMVEQLPNLSDVGKMQEEEEKKQNHKHHDHPDDKVEESEFTAPLHTLGSSEMSNSESRYFKKFGLTPPEQVNKRSSVLLSNKQVSHLRVGTPPSSLARPTQNSDSIQEASNVPYTSASVAATPQRVQQGKPSGSERDPLLQSNTRRPPQRRPPPRDECSCIIL